MTGKGKRYLRKKKSETGRVMKRIRGREQAESHEARTVLAKLGRKGVGSVLARDPGGRAAFGYYIRHGQQGRGKDCPVSDAAG